MNTSSQNIILFDGVCNLCNGAVNFVIDQDKKNHFQFASLQSEFGQRFLSENNLPLNDLKSFYYLKSGRAYSKSTAALYVMKDFGGAWLFLFYIGIICPKFLRDFIYEQVAHNRYTWFGKQSSCRMPSPELQKKFISV